MSISDRFRLFYLGIICLALHAVASKHLSPTSYRLKQRSNEDGILLRWEKTKDFPKVTLTPKQQAWFSNLGAVKEDNRASPKAIRKEIRQLNGNEWRKLVTAMWKMQTTFPDPEEDVSEYGVFVEMHRPENSPAAHAGAGFLPWHREYLWSMEQALRVHDPDVSLVYWDSTLDQLLPDPTDSILWSDTLMGTLFGQVITGPFANWSIIPECQPFHGSILARFGQHNSTINKHRLYSDEHLQSYWDQEEFRQLVFPEYCAFESEHGGGHRFVGGYMGMLTCSPSDPIFWMHHGFIDFIWEEFRQNSQVTDKELEYPTSNDQRIGGEIHEAYMYMEPFSPKYNIHGLSNHYTNYYYAYNPRNIRCREEKDCGSEYLWCDTVNHRCASKIKQGGWCYNLPNESCFGVKSNCISGICS